MSSRFEIASRYRARSFLSGSSGKSSFLVRGPERASRSATRTVAAAREKLRLLGLADGQIADIETRGEASEHVTVLAPLSGVVVNKAALQGAYVSTGTRVYTIADLSVLWLMLEVYESDLEWVKLGQNVAFETDTYPGETFAGTVSFVDPVLTERTRSVKVRVNVPVPCVAARRSTA